MPFDSGESVEYRVQDRRLDGLFCTVDHNNTLGRGRNHTLSLAGDVGSPPSKILGSKMFTR